MKYIALLALIANFAFAIDAEEAKLLALVNAYRIQNGVTALQVSDKLQDSSRWMSYDMERAAAPMHTDTKGRSPQVRMAAFGFTLAPTGENIAGGFQDAQRTFEALRDACDPDVSGVCTYAHRLNFLNPNFKEIGVGRAYSPTSTYLYYWTIDLGGALGGGTPPTPPNPPIPPTPPACGTDCFQGTFDQGDYIFKIYTQNGLRVKIDGVVVFERWFEIPPYVFNIRKSVTSGVHTVTVEHFESPKTPITVTWQKVN